MKQEEFINEINYAIKKMEVVTQELKEARSSLGLVSDAKDMLAVLKIVSFALLSDDETRDAVRVMAKSAKDMNILNYIKRFENVQNRRAW